MRRDDQDVIDRRLQATTQQVRNEGACALIRDVNHIDTGDDPVDPTDDFRLEFKRIGTDLEIDQKWFFVSSEYIVGWDKDTSADEVTTIPGYYVNLVGKTPWRLGPIVRYDTLDSDFKRWTFGAFYGMPGEHLRLMLNYEYRKLMDGVRHDDKLYAWIQA